MRIHPSSSVLSHPLIVIGSREVAKRLADRLPQNQVLAFEHLAEFDSWRVSARIGITMDLEVEVKAALLDLGAERGQLDGKLIRALDLLETFSRVPALDAFVVLLHVSRRTFFRLWSEGFEETPARFFARVRLLHAMRLINEGSAAKEAAWTSGFSSVDHLRRKIALQRKNGSPSPIVRATPAVKRRLTDT